MKHKIKEAFLEQFGKVYGEQQLDMFDSSYKGNMKPYPFNESIVDYMFANISEIVIEHIASEEGWEETADKYRIEFGLKPKYLSECCTASIRNGLCTDCKEHCE